MAGFYGELADVVSELLAPEADGGFGQGIVTLTRVTPGTPDPATPWLPAEPTTDIYTLYATVAAVTVDQANAKFIDGTVITTADLVVTTGPKAMHTHTDGVAITPVEVDLDVSMVDVLTLDGEARTIKRIVQVPAVGTTVLFKLFVQG